MMSFGGPTVKPIRNPEGCRARRNDSHIWDLPGLCWILGKNKLHGTLFSVKSSSPEKEYEEIQQHTTEDSKHHADSKRLTQSSLSEKSYPNKSCISQVPLRLLIKIGCQKDGLGISIAGGRGSLPYMENDEGIFVSRVSRGGPAEKAGVHIGDRVLEVNGQDMQGVSHHEAVSTMRQAGSCIKIKVLRQRLEPTENHTTQEPEHLKTGHLISEHRCSIANRIEAVVCNGLSDLAHGTTPGKDWHKYLKNKNLQLGQHTMTIPRIILTHPSTSDDDVDGVTLSDLDEIYNPDNHVYSDLNSAFYPR